jgi:phosphopantetheine adenylyltransferase
MAKGISFLYDEYKKDPSRIEKLLEEKLEITEKLDGSRFLVQVDESSNILYYKRKDMSITKIDRTLSKYYEKAVDHFENFDEDKISKLPEGWRFGMEYFPNLHPVTISYDRLPLNNLVLTDIQVKDPKDKTIDIITDKETLDKWADILEIERPPIIFEGNLDNSQKTKILDFLNTPYSSLIERFKTENFTTFILTLLNPSLKTSFLHNNMTADIDGLIFKFGGKEVFRVSNPEVAIKKMGNRDEKPSDIYNLTLVILQEFLTGLDFNKIKLKEKTYEERYIEFISKVFNLFLVSSYYKKNFEKGVDFELPRFLTREESRANFKFVSDQDTLMHLEKSSTNRELFKILLASMRSHKKKPSGFFTKELVFHHNALVDKVADYVDNEDTTFKNIKEASIVSFREFKKVFLTETVNWQEDFGKESVDEIENYINEDVINGDIMTLNEPSTVVKPVSQLPTYKQSILQHNYEIVDGPLRVLKKLYTEDDSNISSKKQTPVCVMMGKFQPFHNGHSAVIADAAKESGMKVFLVIVSKKLPNNGISQELHKSMIDEIVNKDSNIHGYIFTNGRSFNEITKDLPSNICAKSFAGSDDECQDIITQTKKKLNSFPMTRHLSSKNVFQAIRDEDYDTYRKLVPKTLHNYFYKIKNELND